MDEPFPLFVAHGEVGPKADVVLEETIGPHLRATASAGPTLGGADELTTDSAPTDVGIDIPPFDVADRAGLASVRVRADRRLHEPRQAAIGTRRSARTRKLARPARSAT